VRTEVTMMVVFRFVGVWILNLHLKDVKKIQNYQKKPTDTEIPTFLLLNTCTMFSGVIGFGKPYVATSRSNKHGRKRLF
jgi:hypothetical protein